MLPTGLWHHRRVTVIKINAITVPPDSGDELAHRFAARAGAVDAQDGFEGFELLKPIDERTTWLVVTRWRDEAAFEAWVSSPAFAHGHRSASESAGEPPQKPVGIHSELRSYEIAGGSGRLLCPVCSGVCRHGPAGSQTEPLTVVSWCRARWERLRNIRALGGGARLA
jgi:heme-degrading monooxygenase HmoA